MALKVPKSYEDDLAMLVALSPTEAEAIVNAVVEVPSALELDEVTGAIATKAHLPEARVKSVVRIVSALYEVRARLYPRKSIAEFASDVVETFEASSHAELHATTPVQRASAAALLDRLLNEPHIAVTAKAASVMRAHEHVFFDSRVLSDLRPVFPADVSGGPVAGVLIHNLKISYYAGADRHDFYVALDSADLEQLRAQVERATLKAKSIRELSKNMNLSLLEPRETDG